MDAAMIERSNSPCLSNRSGSVSNPRTLRGEIAVRLRSNWRQVGTWLFDRAVDRFYDRQFGIATATRRSLADLGITDTECVSYQPVSYTDFRRAMDLAEIRPGDDVFLDFGAGMGRAVCLAATYPFRSVIGVEISAELSDIARANLRRIRHKLRCGDAQIATADATRFPVPREATFIYFFNPFRGRVMAVILANIALSLRENPRRVTVLCYGSPADDELLSPFREAPWLRLKSQSSLPTGCIAAFFENTTWTGQEPVNPL
jgi:hypothetical protein